MAAMMASVGAVSERPVEVFVSMDAILAFAEDAPADARYQGGAFSKLLKEKHAPDAITLVETRREGKNIFYSLARPEVRALHQAFCQRPRARPQPEPAAAFVLSARSEPDRGLDSVPTGREAARKNRSTDVDQHFCLFDRQDLEQISHAPTTPAVALP